jgi:hypothetical protein
MEIFNLSKDIGIICVTASSFPNGIGTAFKNLETLIGSTKDRVFHGISRPDINGTIIYKAGAQEAFEGEADKLGCERFVLKKGDYLVEKITDWRGQEQKIGQTFMQLLSDPRLDTDFPCVEWYKGDAEVMCMIRLDPSK